MAKLNSWLVVKTTVAWMAIAYVVCRAVFWLLPTETVDWFWKPIFHTTGDWSLTGTSFVVGFAEAAIYTALGAWLFVAIYNYFGKR